MLKNIQIVFVISNSLQFYHTLLLAYVQLEGKVITGINLVSQTSKALTLDSVGTEGTCTKTWEALQLPYVYTTLTQVDFHWKCEVMKLTWCACAFNWHCCLMQLYLFQAQCYCRFSLCTWFLVCYICWIDPNESFQWNLRFHTRLKY